MRLIDADALKNALTPPEASGGHKYYRAGMETVLHKFMPKFIDEAPTIEAVPVVHGRWKGAGMGDYRCSLCDETVSGNHYNYCPYCGAKMD